MAHPFAVQDKSTRKIQDLNPECKEGSIPIMLLWGITGKLIQKVMKITGNIFYMGFLIKKISVRLVVPYITVIGPCTD